MIQEVNDWNEETRKREDAIALAMWKWTQGLITEEEYENVVEPDKGARTRCPTEWGGHGDNLACFSVLIVIRNFVLMKRASKEDQ
jgi:hypothetical protein